MNREELFNQFMKEERIKGRREQGLLSLKRRIPKFFRYLDEIGLTLIGVGTEEALSYQLWLIETGRRDGKSYSMRTITSYIIPVTSFYEYLKISCVVLNNPFKEIRKVRREKKLPTDILKEEQMGLLLDELENFMDETDLRRIIRKYKFHIICEVLYSTGLRVSEISSLRLDDIDLVRGLVSVREGKGGFFRTAILNDYARSILSIYIDEIRPLILTSWHDETLLFGTATWSTFGKVVNKGLKEYSEKVKIPPVRCHGFRHALGYHLLRSGCSVKNIQGVLGHKALRNTEIYTKVDKEDLKCVLDRFHPRQKKRGKLIEDKGATSGKE